MRLRWAHFCGGGGIINGEWRIDMIVQGFILRPEMRNRFPRSQFIAAVEIDENEALRGVAKVRVSSDEDGTLLETQEVELTWTRFVPGCPAFTTLNVSMGGMPLPRTGRYTLQVVVNDVEMGESELFVLPESGKSIAPPSGVRRRGHSLNYAHVAKNIRIEPTGISFEAISEMRFAKQPGPVLLRGLSFGGQIDAGVDDLGQVRCRVEVRASNGVPIKIGPDMMYRFDAFGKGHLKHATFGLALPAMDVMAPGDYVFAVVVNGKDAGGIEYPVMIGG